jgi:hypothetical protein
VKNIEQIVNEAGMSERPGYYSGRGATLSDLDSNKLQKIYTGIYENYGQEAAAAYAQAVFEIEVLSATAFLCTLFNLNNNNWVFNSRVVVNEDSGFSNEGEALGHMLSVFGGSRNNDQTREIGWEFLRNMGFDPKTDTYGNYEDPSTGYIYNTGQRRRK